MRVSEATRPWMWLLGTLSAVIVFICALFTCVASWTLVLLFWRQGSADASGLVAKLCVKGVLFGLVSLASAYALTRLARRRPNAASRLEEEPPGAEPQRFTARSAAALAVVLCIAGLLAFPRLDRYPRPEPDETHHLVVARNLAEYGLYASGHPDTGFEVLDDYDSVGPVVILPVAAALKVFGTDLIVARAVMGAFFLALCTAVFFFSFRLFGAGASALGGLMTVAALGSVYLGRSLYGEVPALLFLIVGLCVWRHALHAKGYGLGILAGLLFGMSVLCKAFMINSAWAFLGALLYDRLTYRRIALRHLVGAAAGTLAVMGAWWAIQKACRSNDADITVDTLSVYGHNLMFGIRSAYHPLLWLLKQPVSLGVSVLALGFSAPLICQKRYDPPAVVLFLFIPFMAYWWVFFTNGLHPRYAWYMCTLAGLFAGLLGWRVLACVSRTTPHWLLAGLLVLFGLVVVPPLDRTALQVRLAFADDEMKDERDLAAYVRSLPKETAIATTAWPLERLLNFLTGRSVSIMNGLTQETGDVDVVIVDMELYDSSQLLEIPFRTFGRFVVFERKRR